MKKFGDMSYKRLTACEVNATRAEQLEKFKGAQTLAECIDVYKEIEKYTYEVCWQMENLAYIRYTMDTTDEFYDAENDYWDEATPEMEQLEKEITKALLASPFRAELEKQWGGLLFLNEEISLKTFNEAIVEDLKEENRLSSEYDNLMSSAQIEFNGKTHTLEELGAYYSDIDREVRKGAHEANRNWRLEKVDEVESIFDQLVKVRATIAEKLGHENFVETGYYRMNRNSYDKDMVTQFREGVIKHIVPIVTKLKEEQKNRIEVDMIKPYDVELMFLDGNAKPTGAPDEIFAHARKMYKEMSASTEEAWNFMQDHDLLDVMIRPGKSPGGYQTVLPAYGAPFIFANFNGTSGDIDVLTHEVGHAWAYYLARDIFPTSLQYAPDETSEIHSMAMEFFAWPWMEGFFGEKTEKYYYAHLSEAITFLPYGAMVDEFQHHVYENAGMTKEQRNQLWLELESKYRPWLDVEDVPFDEEGRRWQTQSHIFSSPFYYIDYVLAGTVALSFWAKSRQNFADAWEKYHTLTSLAGTKTFVELLKDADMPSPFVADNLKLVADEARKFLDANKK